MIPLSRGLHIDHSLVTIEDAVPKLRRRSSEPSNPWRARVDVVPTRVSPLVILVGQKDSNGLGSSISMAPSTHFTGRRAIEPQRQRREILLLHSAIVDDESNVELADGTYVYDVRLEPGPYYATLSEGEKHALWAVLSWVFRDDPTKYQYKCQLFLQEDLDTLAVRVPNLEAIEQYMRERVREDPSLVPVSRKTIRAALMKSGLWQPRRGKRAA